MVIPDLKKALAALMLFTVPAQAQAQAQAEPKRVIVFDASYSMIAPRNSGQANPRLPLAKQISKRLFNRPLQPDDALPALVVFGDFNVDDTIGNCNNVDVSVRGGARTASALNAINRTIDRVQARGRTPIVQSLDLIAREFDDEEIRVVIVTDFDRDPTCMGPQTMACSNIERILRDDTGRQRIFVDFIVTAGIERRQISPQLKALRSCLDATLLPMPDGRLIEDHARRILTGLYPDDRAATRIGITPAAPPPPSPPAAPNVDRAIAPVFDRTTGTVVVTARLPSSVTADFQAAPPDRPVITLSGRRGQPVPDAAGRAMAFDVPAATYDALVEWRGRQVAVPGIRVVAGRETRVDVDIAPFILKVDALSRNGRPLDKEFEWQVTDRDGRQILFAGPRLLMPVPKGTYAVSAKKGETGSPSMVEITVPSGNPDFGTDVVTVR